MRAAALPKEKRVVTEDYFRVLKERKLASQKPTKTVPARVSQFASQLESGEDGEKISPDKALHGMPYWLSIIDPEMDDDQALQHIELPYETMYLIDKVVRQKAKAGPIGIDNSEFINIEIEEEYK